MCMEGGNVIKDDDWVWIEWKIWWGDKWGSNILKILTRKSKPLTPLEAYQLKVLTQHCWPFWDMHPEFFRVLSDVWSKMK